MMRPKQYIFYFLLLGRVVSLQQSRGKEISELQLPLLANGAPDAVIVNVSLTISKMKIINIKTMGVQYEALLHQRWIDEQLGPDQHTQKLAVARAVWKPKLTFSEGQALVDADESSQFWRGSRAGNVLYSERYTINSDCTRNFHLYPFDKQRCFLKISTFRFPMSEVHLKWQARSPVDMQFNLDLNYFKIIDLIVFSEVEKRPSGNFSVLVTELLLSRRAEHLLLVGVLPSVVLVLASYLTFWIDLKSRCTRILVSFFSSLAVIAVHQNMNSDLPHTPYTKPSDIWSMLCCCFTFLPLVETVIVVLLRDGQDEKEEFPDRTPRLLSKHFLSITLDKLSRLIHPLLFLCCTALLAVCYAV